MIWFVCPDTNTPSGGILVIYRHVRHLVEAGIRAAVVHERRGFAPTWFDTTGIPIVCADDVDADPASDLLVIPEIYGPDLAEIGDGVRKAVFNQNAYNTFAGYPTDLADRRTPYTHPDVVGVVVVSDDNAAYLRHAFPELRVHVSPPMIDPAQFHPREAKRRRIAFMPRKGAEHALQVINILKFRGALDDVELLPLDGMTQDEIAAELRQSLIFLSLGYPEGCPCPPREAMASGCLTIGYHGMGGRDFFDSDHGFPVPQGDIVAYAKTVEAVLDRHRTEPDALEAFAQRAAASIAERYSPANERDSAVAVWSALASAPRAAAAPLATAAAR